MLITTTNDLPGYEINEMLGEVFGLTVRSRNVGSQIGAGLKSIMGGELKGMTKALVDSREQVIERMVEEAEAKGGDAIVAMRFDTSEMGANWTEICAYGTAVKARKSVNGSRGRLRPLEHDRGLAGRRSGRGAAAGRRAARAHARGVRRALVRRPRPPARDGADRGRARALRPLAGGCRGGDRAAAGRHPRRARARAGRGRDDRRASRARPQDRPDHRLQRGRRRRSGTETAFHGLFDAEVFSAAVGLRKPDPRIYRLALELLHVEPAEAVFVGDGANDELAGAERVGMTAIDARAAPGGELRRAGAGRLGSGRYPSCSSCSSAASCSATR